MMKIIKEEITKRTNFIGRIERKRERQKIKKKTRKIQMCVRSNETKIKIGTVNKIYNEKYEQKQKES